MTSLLALVFTLALILRGPWALCVIIGQRTQWNERTGSSRYFLCSSVYIHDCLPHPFTLIYTPAEWSVVKDDERKKKTLKQQFFLQIKILKNFMEWKEKKTYINITTTLGPDSEHCLFSEFLPLHHLIFWKKNIKFLSSLNKTTFSNVFTSAYMLLFFFFWLYFYIYLFIIIIFYSRWLEIKKKRVKMTRRI